MLRSKHSRSTHRKRARDDLLKQLGTVEPLELERQSASTAAERPKWPALRQSFKLVHRPEGTVLLVSDGLSDPFDDVTLGDGNVNGYGLEFYIESPAGELPEQTAEVTKSWQFQLLYTVSQLAAGHGGIRSILDDMKLLSTEAEGVNEAMPEERKPQFVNDAGRVGALLGLRSNDRQDRHSRAALPERFEGMPLTDVVLVNIKLLTLNELKLITDKGTEARRRLSDTFTGPTRLVSSAYRDSVI
ncbi:hypothetical protein WJX73_006128 [Symbiochloris irregularis]|uniref:Uncharacterized protein n=1 Tax=Symbiochloris irregularis TaxID=706552 RepID=A0AAW1NXX0_9CHLO